MELQVIKRETTGTGRLSTRKLDLNENKGQDRNK